MASLQRTIKREMMFKGMNAKQKNYAGQSAKRAEKGV